ncbi:hypothetical protein HC766_01325 [Candidatus Gracilibacteria bacterium]|nr:hypothetical protein [Candidatus Gracilibacteria bacterium]
MNPKRLITILGPTSSGKSNMAIELANLLKSSAIVNCDSRQIYKDLNLGTGKVQGSWQKHCNQNLFIFQNQPHYLIDYIDPNQPYSLTKYLNDFYTLTQSLSAQNIILVGGTGLYADAIINNYQIPNLTIEQQKEFQSIKTNLNQLSLQELQKIFQKRTKLKLNDSDFKNPRRLVNHILQSDPKFTKVQVIPIPQFSSKQVFAIDILKEELHLRINKRLNQRLYEGLISEVKTLNLASSRLQELGLEYKLIDDYLHQKISPKNLLSQMLTKNFQYAKKQITWLNKRDLVWIKNTQDILDNLSSFD